MIGRRTLFGGSSHVDQSVVPPPAGRPFNFKLLWLVTAPLLAASHSTDFTRQR